MDDAHDHSVDTAREAAQRGELANWVGSFLASAGSDNAELAEQLTSGPRWWHGPMQLPIDQLHRLAGPPDAPVMEAVTEDEWRDDVDDLARDIEDGLEPPPVIVTYRDDQLVLEDGNHRVEALRRAGRTEAWAVVAFEDASDQERFEASTG